MISNTENYFDDDEQNLIIELKQRMENVDMPEELRDDIIFYKFLKARQFKVNQAEAMLKKHIKWRKEYEIEGILKEFKQMEVLEKYISGSFLGYDKEGCPVRYTAAGNMDHTGIFKSATVTDILKNEIYLIETDIKRTKEQTKKLGKLVSQFVYIHNLENWTFFHATNKNCLEFLPKAASLLQDNYPERLKTVIAINAPFYFRLTFSILKSLLSHELLKKFKVFGSSDWKEELLSLIDEDVLPAFLGGKRTDPDGNPLCNTFVNHGYPVPERYYLTNLQSEFLKHPDVDMITVEGKDTSDVPINVNKPNSEISWEFTLNQKEIEIGLYYKDSKNVIAEDEELIPYRQVEASLSIISGSFCCDKPGVYILRFNNSFSKEIKDIYYKTDVKCRGEES